MRTIHGFWILLFLAPSFSLAAAPEVADERLQSNVAPLADTLKKMSSLRGVAFDWKDSKMSKEQGRQIGLVAQEVEKSFPELVKEADVSGEESKKLLKGGKAKAVDYPKFTAVLLQGLNELTQFSKGWIGSLRNENQTLKAELTAAKTEIAGLKAELAALKGKESTPSSSDSSEMEARKNEIDELRQMIQGIHRRLTRAGIPRGDGAGGEGQGPSRRNRGGPNPPPGGP
jgi:hypothetical protein